MKAIWISMIAAIACLIMGLMTPGFANNITAGDNSSQSWTWQDYATIAGIGFGLITLLAYLDQRRSSKAYDTIIEFAKRNLDYNISQEDIKNSQAEIKRLDQNRQRLGDQIKSLARDAALREKARANANSAARSYSEWQKAKRELEDSSLDDEVDPSILDEISTVLVPEYERRVAKEAIRDKITVLSVGFVILNNLMRSLFNIVDISYRFIDIGNILLALFIVAFSVQYYRLSTNDQDLQKIVRIGTLVAYGFAMGLGIFFIAIAIIAFTTSAEWEISGFFGIFGISILVLGVLIYPKLKSELGQFKEIRRAKPPKAGKS